MFHKRLIREFKENWKYVFGVVLTQWVMLLANICLVFASANILNTIRLGKLNQEQIKNYAFLTLAVIIVRIFMTKLNGYFSFQAAVNTKTKLRILLYEKLLCLGASYKEDCSTSELVQLSTEGVEQLEIYFGRYIPQFFYAVLAPVTLFFVVGSMNFLVAMVLLICVPLIPIAIICVQKFAKKLFAKYWGSYTELGDHFLEYIQGLTTMKIYQADEHYAKKMHEESEKFRKMTMRVLIMQLNSITVMDLIAYGAAALGIIFGLLAMRAGDVTFTQGIFIVLISAEFFLPMRLLGSFFHISMNGNAAAEKIFRILDLPEMVEENEEEIKEDTIIFKNLNFSYKENKERKILDHISLEISPRKLVAFAGESGCGKSTIASLLTREQIGYQGEVFIGGYELHKVNSKILHKKITRINHNSYLFAGTVRDNLKMGNPTADLISMNEALKQVRLFDFVYENGGLDMKILENADNISGGQKQRLALARAILHDSDIYIFDEATSNIDVKSEELIMETVRVMAKSKTIILISHRLANLVDADEIFMMEQGRIVEKGTHKELSQKKNGSYARIYESQKMLEEYTSYNENENKKKQLVEEVV